MKPLQRICDVETLDNVNATFYDCDVRRAFDFWTVPSLLCLGRVT